MRRRVLLVGLAIWSLTPLALLAVVSVAGGWRFPTLLGDDPGLAAWRSLGGGALGHATSTSLALGIGTGVGAAAVGLLAGRALARERGGPRTLGLIFAFLPVATPPLLLGIGLQFTFLRLGLGGTAAGVWLAHLVPAIGYTTLYFVAVFTSWDFGIERAARQLGATRRQTLVRVIAPLLRRPLAEAALLGFLVSWAQVPLTLLVGQGRVRSLTIEVLSLVQAGQDGLAAAGALVLLLPPLLLIALATWGVREAEVVVA
ncbi:MAG: ABC transporter permease subunit [Longimicrobiales bacterium]|nr:ABC transporter permease subunit [Longimicrobiales bacterium]